MDKVAKSYLTVLKRIADRLGQSEVLWAVTGSLGSALQGVPLEPHDIDIQTDKSGAYEIERLLSQFVTEKVHLAQTDRIRSHFGAFEIDGIRVEVMGDVQKQDHEGIWRGPPDLTRIVRYLEIEHTVIPVLSIEYECQAYKQLGRDDRADFLRQWLRQRRYRSGGGEQ